MKYFYKIDDRAKDGRLYLEIGNGVIALNWELKSRLLLPTNAILLLCMKTSDYRRPVFKDAFEELDD